MTTLQKRRAKRRDTCRELLPFVGDARLEVVPVAVVQGDTVAGVNGTGGGTAVLVLVLFAGGVVGADEDELVVFAVRREHLNARTLGLVVGAALGLVLHEQRVVHEAHTMIPGTAQIT